MSSLSLVLLSCPCVLEAEPTRPRVAHSLFAFILLSSLFTCMMSDGAVLLQQVDAAAAGCSRLTAYSVVSV